ncbi:hypothetical protein BUALT_Bualt14G0035500 [Buddleja alternifolia]|uniref:ubiquitinyl hydrolase 1 n=1 Tax=Buddleja alternifolia TaxID=168488 RepID=A0AAV6WHI4_9LAMI|nr:hypothetical protein BUALT_Bualt14G0035500 [Buddleja alternifolia]
MIEAYADSAALAFAGNVSLEAAGNWIVNHENNRDIDQMSLALMAKKVKKRAKSGQKEKWGTSTSPKTVSRQRTSDTENPHEGVAAIKGKELCSHIDRGINLDELCHKVGSSEPLECEDCRENVADRQAKKGKSKHGKKGGINSKSESKAIWICLECGHFSCGGVGLPTTPQSHALRHAKRNHHSLVVHYQNHQLLWCFPCNRLISAEKSEDKQKEVLDEVVKLLKGRPDGEKSNVDIEDVWFGSGSVTSAIKSDYSASVGEDRNVAYSIRGLVNLGNTCFFNSIMQNLLAINRFRDYFFNLDESVGTLSASMRKLFLETATEGGSRSAINPRSLFGSLCTKAPQFRGYQQHDSHELLRCLLDGLSTEELSAKKRIELSQASVTDPIFVDAIFGGKLSSTVSCLECGHSSTIYEPFLDLSLPVPTKKPPPKKIQPVTRGKKPKLPPKRSGRNLSKVSKAHSLPRESVSGQSTGGNSLDDVQSIVKPAEELVLFSGDAESSDAIDPNAIALDMGLTPEDLSAIQKPKDQQAVENVGEQSISSDSLSWLDYLEPSTISQDIDIASETDEISMIQGSSNEDVLKNNVSCSILDSTAESKLINDVSETTLDNAKQLNALEPGILPQQQNAFPLYEDKQTVDPQFNEKVTLNGSSTEEVVKCDADIGHSTGSCNQVCTKDSNTSGSYNEIPSQVQDTEVILLPYKEDASSSVEVLREEIEVSTAVVGDEQDSLDFDGFGDLFNEPEVTSELLPSDHQVSGASDMTKNVVIGNGSDSDPNEVDDADAPVSVESCLALFMKPELLSKDEHAWQCDNCSKNLHEERIRSRRKFQMSRVEILPNGCEDRNPSGVLEVEETCLKMKCTNGIVEKDAANASDGSSLPQNREIYDNGNCMLGKHPETEINVITGQSENAKPQKINACHGSSECSSSNDRNPNPCSVELGSDRDEFPDTNLVSAKCESEANDEEEVKSENLKVKRDATKSLLIDKAPPILTIHLKRFSQDARGRLSKLNGHVNFREMIDLKPYMDPRCMERERGLRYRLVGVVEHSGSMRGGHYVAYVRGGSGDDCAWYHASDAYVSKVSLEQVLRCEAYILFYETI